MYTRLTQEPCCWGTVSKATVQEWVPVKPAYFGAHCQIAVLGGAPETVRELTEAAGVRGAGLPVISPAHSLGGDTHFPFDPLFKAPP